jgi:hypothetical protein
MRPKYSWILVAVASIGLAVGASFGAGTVYGRNSATTTTVTVTGGTQTGQGASLSGQSTGGGSNLTGTVASIAGQTLKITTAAGTEVTVNLADSAQIGKAGSSDKSALAPGASVLILGQRQQDGSVNGSEVLVVPQGFVGQ